MAIGSLGAASLSGRVTRNADGSAIAGAIVTIARPSSGVSDVPAIVATTDSDGRWAATGVTRGVYAIAATARGFQPAIRDAVEIPATVAARHRSRARRGMLTGTVSDVNGARSPAHASRCTAPGTGARSVELVALTGMDGAYRVTSPPVRISSRRRTRITCGAGRTSKSSARRNAQFHAHPRCHDRGRVIGRQRRPVPDATVLAVGPGVQRSPIDGDGKFAHHLGGGAIWISAYGRDHATTATMLVPVSATADGVELVADRVRDRGRVRTGRGAGSQGPLSCWRTTPPCGFHRASHRRRRSLRDHRRAPGQSSHRRRSRRADAGQDGRRDRPPHQRGDRADSRATLSGRVEPPAVTELKIAVDGDIPRPVQRALIGGDDSRREQRGRSFRIAQRAGRPVRDPRLTKQGWPARSRSRRRPLTKPGSSCRCLRARRSRAASSTRMASRYRASGVSRRSDVVALQRSAHDLDADGHGG